MNTNTSKEQAETIITKLYSELFLNADATKVEQFYSKDFIGHYPFDSHNFSQDDVKNRIVLLERDTKKRTMQINKITVIGSLIQCLSTLRWQMKADNSLYSWQFHASYRLNNKDEIVEQWLLDGLPELLPIDAPDEPVVQQFVRHVIEQTEINTSLKREFFEQFKIFENTVQHKNDKLSRVEKTCLYYYYYGYSSKEISIEIGLAARTVEQYICAIKEKLGFSNRYQLRTIIGRKPEFPWKE